MQSKTVIKYSKKVWTILSGLRKAGIIGTETDDDSDINDSEEETPHLLTLELAELFKSDTEDENFFGFCDLE